MTIWRNVTEWSEDPFGTIWLIEWRQKSQAMTSQLLRSGPRILAPIGKNEGLSQHPTQHTLSLGPNTELPGANFTVFNRNRKSIREVAFHTD